MEIDRKLQNSVLKLLQVAYPKTLLEDEIYWVYIENKFYELNTWDDIFDFIQMPKDKIANRHLLANLAYLEEHDLIRHKQGKLQATAKGIDLIANDGGLSAILNRQTVRLDEHAINQLTQSLIQLDKPTLYDLLFQIITQLVTSSVGVIPQAVLDRLANVQKN